MAIGVCRRFCRRLSSTSARPLLRVLRAEWVELGEPLWREAALGPELGPRDRTGNLGGALGRSVPRRAVDLRRPRQRLRPVCCLLNREAQFARIGRLARREIRDIDVSCAFLRTHHLLPHGNSCGMPQILDPTIGMSTYVENALQKNSFRNTFCRSGGEELCLPCRRKSLAATPR